MAANNPSLVTREDLRQELQNELRHYATKEDVANLRTDISQAETRLIKWMVASVLAGAAVAAAITSVIQRFVA